MILPWIYMLLSRGEIFKHGDLFFAVPRDSDTIMVDILPIAKLNQIATLFPVYLPSDIHPSSIFVKNNFKLLAYLNCKSSADLSFLKEFLQATNISTILLVKWDDSLPEISIWEYFSAYSSLEFAGRMSIASHLYVLTNSTLYEIYYDIDHEIVVQKLEQGLERESYLSSRKNFHMDTIIAGHTKNFSGTFSSSSTVAEMGGNISLTYQYLGYMQDFLNFKVQLVQSKDWSKMAERILHQTNDVGVSASAISVKGIRHFKFLMPPTYVDHLTIHYLPVQEEGSTIFVHLKTFQTKIWIAIFVILLMIGVCYSVTSWPLCFYEPVWLILCCFCQQSCPIGKPSYVRVLTFTCSVFCIIIYAMYSGSLISAMSTQSNSLFSIQQLIDSGYRFGIHNSSDTFYSSTAFKSDDPVSRRVIANLHPKAEFQYPLLSLGIQTVLSTEKYALITEMSVSSIVSEFQRQKENLSQRCWPLFQFPIPHFSVQQTFITRNDSPLAKYLNLARFTMTERGISDAIMKRRSNYIRGLKANCEIIREGERPFTIRDVAVPLSIMSLGILFSIMVLAAEIIYKRKDALFTVPPYD